MGKFLLRGIFWLVPQFMPFCFSGTHVWQGWRCRNGRTATTPHLLHERDEQKENLSRGDRNEIFKHSAVTRCYYAVTSWTFTWALNPLHFAIHFDPKVDSGVKYILRQIGKGAVIFLTRKKGGAGCQFVGQSYIETKHPHLEMREEG